MSPWCICVVALLVAVLDLGAAPPPNGTPAPIEEILRLEEKNGPAALDAAVRWQATLSAPRDLLAADLLLARILHDLGNRTEAQTHAESALASARRLHSPLAEGEAEMLLAALKLRGGDLEGARERSERAIDLLASAPPRLRAEALLRHAFILYWFKPADALAPLVEQLHQLADDAPDPRVDFRYRHAAAFALFASQRHDEARQQFQQMLALARAANSPALVAMATGEFALVATRTGDLHGGEKLYRESIAQFRAIGWQNDVTRQLNNLAMSLLRQDRPAEALPLLDEALALRAVQLDEVRLRTILDSRSQVLKALGRIPAAIADLEQASAIVTRLQLRRVEADTAARLAELYSLQGDHRRAYALAVTAAEKRARDFDLSTRQRVLELEQTFAVERKQAQIERLHQENRLQSADLSRRRSVQQALAIGLFVALLLAGLAGVFWLRYRRTNQQLLATNTELQRARERADSASEAKSQFLAKLSHELRTPLNAIIGLAEILGRTRQSEDFRRLPALIGESAEHLLSLITDILDFSKTEAGKLRLAHAPFSLAAAVERPLALLAPLAQRKRLTLRHHIPDDCAVTLVGDELRFRQILTNFVGNALKFTPSGEVTVTLARLAAADGLFGARVTVTDTGPGIPAEAQARLFQAFSQVDDSTTRVYGGTGLGLVISKQLTELMGGRIGFDTEPSRGSTFWFELALPLSQAPTAESVPTSPVDAAPRPLHILAADDNELNRIVVERQLLDAGHQVEFAHDGQQLLARLSARRYDVVLVDCQMPVIDGYDATRRIRSGLEPAIDPRTPIIALTALAGHDDHARCLEAGMDDYLAKPFRLAELQRALARLGLAPAAVPTSVAPARALDTVLDPATLARLSAMRDPAGQPLLPMLVEIFCRDTETALTEIATSIEQTDSPRLRALAHKLAGSASHLGAYTIQHIATAIGTHARTGDWARCAASFEDLRADWRNVRAALEASTMNAPLETARTVV